MTIPVIELSGADPLRRGRVHGEGSGHEFGGIPALNARGELTYRNPFGERTSFSLQGAAPGDGRVYRGQNGDGRTGAAGPPVLLRIEQPGRRGVDSTGLSLPADGLGAQFPRTMGVPVTFIRRKILDTNPVEQQLTIASSLVDLSTGEYRIAAGPPCETPYELVPHNIYDGPATHPRPGALTRV